MPRLLRRVAPTVGKGASLTAPPALRPARLRHFSSRHRTGFAVSATPCAGAGRRAAYFIAMVPQGSAPPFSPAGCRTDRLVPTERLGRPPPTRVSPDGLRPLSGSARAPAQPWGLPMSRCSRPTGFGGPPLLPGYPAPLRSQRAFTRRGVRHLSRPMSGALDVTPGFTGGHRSVGGPDLRSCLPGRKHSFKRCLIPAPYSCRTHSPGDSEARGVTPDFTNPPFPSGRLSPAGLIGGIRHPAPSDRTGYFVDPLGLTENRHAMTRAFRPFASGRRRAELLLLLRLSLLGQSTTTLDRVPPLGGRAFQRRVGRSEA